MQAFIAEGEAGYERKAEERLQNNPELAWEHVGGDADQARRHLQEFYAPLQEQGLTVREPGPSNMLAAMDDELERAASAGAVSSVIR